VRDHVIGVVVVVVVEKASTRQAGIDGV